MTLVVVVFGLMWLGACAPETGSKQFRQVPKGSPAEQEGAPAKPATPAITLATQGVQDGLYVVEAFVRHAPELRGYQVTLAVSSGEVGELTLENISVDAERADYVFGKLKAVNATDLGRGRLAGALFKGTVDASGPAYLGTFAYRATPGARGAFQVSLRSGRHSALFDAASERMEYVIGSPAEIRIGALGEE